MKKLFSIISVALVVVALSVSCTKDNTINNNGNGGSKPSDTPASTSVAGTTWSTAEQLGLGTLTLSFTAKDCTLKLTNGKDVESCTYPYTLSGNTLKTKVKMSVWSRGEEQEATGTINGNDMNFKLAKNGSNYVFSKK
jgi:hypothetical protein